jgi:hypothetical protein
VPNQRHNLKDEHFLTAFGDHEIAVHDDNCYHVCIEARTFHKDTGQKLSVPRVQIFNPQMWEFMKNKTRYFEGQSVFVLHDPTIPDTEQDEEPVMESGETTSVPFAFKGAEDDWGSEETEEEYTITDVKKVGKATAAKLAKADIHTVEELAEIDTLELPELMIMSESTGIKPEDLKEYAANAAELIG